VIVICDFAWIAPLRDLEKQISGCASRQPTWRSESLGGDPQSW
jgi:hypothetical protein